MKAEIFLNSVGERLMALVALVAIAFFSFPEAMYAAGNTTGQTNTEVLVFQVKPNQTENLINPKQLSYSELAENDPLVKKLTAYLQKYNAELAQDADQIVKLPQWQRALAISFVESNFCEKAKNFNCGSLGVAPGHPAWRKYESKYHGLADLTRLLEKPLYKERLNTCQKMKGVYVVPGSSSWVNGCNKVSNDLLTLTREAEQERQTASVLSNAEPTAVIKTAMITER